MDVIRIHGFKGRLVALACATMIAAPLATAARADTVTDQNGRRMECHYETEQADKGHPIAAPVIGAIAGGAVGNQFGGGSGKSAATAVGAVGGAYAGKKYNDKTTDQDQVTRREVCTPVNG